MAKKPKEPPHKESMSAAYADKAGPFNNPFEALRGDATPSVEPTKPTATSAMPETKCIPGPRRAVVRMERKGHGGKEVIVIEQLELSQRDLERWLKELKQSLGCGGTVEQGRLVLQGDHRERVTKLLAQRGVKKISIG